MSALDEMAERTGTQPALVDADTNARSLTRELRWNQAYYGLAQGLRRTVTPWLSESSGQPRARTTHTTGRR